MPGPRHPRREPRSPEHLGSSEEMAWRFPLPMEVAHQATGLQTCLNLGLWLDHFTEWEERRGELKRAEASDKRQQIPKSFNFSELCQLLSAYRNRWDRMLDALRAQNYIVQKFTLRAASRVIVGLGAESVLETSIRLHRIYGFPVIPGSALKGLARAYAELVKGKNESDPVFADIFGKGPPESQAGKVLFLDAVPANPANLTLELDVMNPHYAPYYQGKEPPADYHNPVPVFFLTIGPDSEFLFAVISKKSDLAQQAESWLKKGLTEMGIGAKTVAGYGLWKNGTELLGATSAAEALSSTVSPGSSQEVRAARADRPEILKELPRKTDARIPAEIVDNTSKPVKVRLLVEGYLEKPVACSGIRNPQNFPPGTFVWVTISQKEKDGTIAMVRLAGLWKAF